MRSSGQEPRRRSGRRPDRQPEDGSVDRERSVPGRELGARSPADTHSQPAVLGPASRVSRSRSSSDSGPRTRTGRICSAAAKSTWPSGTSPTRRPLFVATGCDRTCRDRALVSGLFFRTAPPVAILRSRQSPSAAHSLTRSIALPSFARARNTSLRICGRSRARLPRPEPVYRTAWSGYGYRPATPVACCRGGLSPRPDGIYSCGGVRLSLRFVTPAGYPARGAGPRAHAGAARTIWCRGHPGVRRPGVFEAKPLERGFRRRVLRIGYSTRTRPENSIYGCGGGAELHRLLPAARDHRPRPGGPDPRRAASRRGS